MIHFGEDIEVILRRLPAAGPLFPPCNPFALATAPRSSSSDVKDSVSRASRCTPITTHAAERAKQCGYPERFAQEALVLTPRAVHRLTRARQSEAAVSGELRAAQVTRRAHHPVAVAFVERTGPAIGAVRRLNRFISIRSTLAASGWRAFRFSPVPADHGRWPAGEPCLVASELFQRFRGKKLRAVAGAMGQAVSTSLPNVSRFVVIFACKS